MDTWLAFVIALVVTIICMRGYLKKLTHGQKSAFAGAPASAENTACPSSNITLSAAGNRQTIRVPLLDENFETRTTIISTTRVRIQTNEKVERMERDAAAGGLRVTMPKGSYRAAFVVLAIGKRGTPRKPGVPGEEQSHVAYRLIEADSYVDRDIVVAGGGDSPVEAALGLAKGGRNRVTLVHRGLDFSRARERNRELLEQAIAEGHILPKLRTNFQSIGANTVVIDQAGSMQEMRADYVFVLMGGESPDEFLCRAGVENVEKAVAA